MTTTPIAVPKGLEGVVAASTRMSHVDGLAGELIIGGYRLDEIAGRATFEEIAFVLWNLAIGQDGDLPKKDEFDALQKQLADMRPISDAALGVIRAARHAPPMDALRMAMAMMSLDDAGVKDELPAANAGPSGQPENVRASSDHLHFKSSGCNILHLAARQRHGIC